MSLVTGLSYAGFVVRDVLMARFFGLGEEVAQFQLAGFLPFFLASVLTNPLYSLLVPEIIQRELISSSSSSSLRHWLADISGSVAAFFLGISLLVFVLSGLVVTGESSPYHFSLLLALCCVVLAMSANVVVANALLNALGKPVAAATPLAVVPLIAIITLLVCGQRWGSIVLAAGMVLGQTANYLIVRSLCRRLGYTLGLWGNPKRWLENNLFIERYSTLVLIGLLLYSTQPVAVMLSKGLGNEVIAALAIGGKGLSMMMWSVWIISSFVILPHFSRLADKDVSISHQMTIRTIWYGVMLSSLVSLIIFLSAPFLVSAFFEGGAFQHSDSNLVGRIIAIGGLQVPFFVVIQLFEKLSSSKCEASGVVLPLMLGLVVNVIFSLISIDSMGIDGVMLGASVGMGTAMLFVLISSARARILSKVDLYGLLAFFSFYGLLAWTLNGVTLI